MQDRTSEWFVPKIGPKKFRICVGILFLPYTAIVTCFALWGSIGTEFAFDRLAAIGIIYFLAVGVAAHCLDAVGGKNKPWGILPKRKTVSIAILALAIVFTIGSYYAFLDSPMLLPIGIIEGFFLFAYNLELFRGRFHNNISTVISWGVLPVFAGSVIQTNSISIETILLSGISAAITYFLITTSRIYKKLIRENIDAVKIKNKEIILKLITLAVIIGTIVFFILRI
jgi:hypothetical protein